MRPDGDYEIGYGRPPKAHQFRKGRSGNSKGRPKSKGVVAIDLDAILETQINFVDPAGRTQRLTRSEFLARKQMEKALGGDLRAMAAVIKQLIRYDALKLGEAINNSGVVVVPDGIPMQLASILATMFGKPPWSTAEIARASAVWHARAPEDAAPFIAQRSQKAKP